MEITEIIAKWKINKQLLASKIGLERGTFQNKLNPEHPTQFTDTEIILLKSALLELRHDLNSIDEIGFDALMKVIMQKQI